MSSSATAIAEHGADEAGGEAVYSSDGLPPLTTSAPPIRASDAPASTLGGDDVIDDGGSVDPSAAFEVFSGRVFVRDDRPGRPSVSPSAVGSMTITTGKAETPYQRLARLRAEATELESDLAASATASDGTGSGAAVSDDALTRMARELSTRLTELSTVHVGLDDEGGPASALRGRQDDLTGLVRRELERMQSESVTSAEDAGGAGASSGEKGDGVVYELYRSAPPAPGAAAPAATARAASLEERVRRVERLVGSSVGGGTVLERLEKAEKLAKRVDGKEIEKAGARAKVIRADLEAAAKAKAKLSSTSLSSSSSAEDAKTLSSLHDQMVELEGVSGHLPAIVARLAELSALHGQAADFATRLVAVENAASDTEKLVRSAEDALNRVERGFSENVNMVEKNMTKLDEKMAALSSS